MQRDFAYCLWRVVDSGLTITAPYARLVNWFIYLADALRLAGRPLPCAEQDHVALGVEVELSEVLDHRFLHAALEGEVGLLQGLSGGEPGGLDPSFAAVAVAGVDLG